MMTTLRQQKAYEHAVRLHNRAAKCQSVGEPNRPEKLYLRSLELKERLFGPNHVEVGLTLNNLGLYYKSIGRLAEARDTYQRALPIFQNAFGGSHSNVAAVLYNMAQLLKKESEAMEARSQMIQEAADELAQPAWRERAVIRRDRAHYRLTVAPSRIHRFGVFAAEPIPAGADIIEYTGERVSRREWAPRCRQRTYLLKLDNYWCLDGSKGGSGAELINHCCEPNCKFTGEGGGRWVASLRPISAGEELLLDYNFSKDCGTVPCYCGAPACRGTINRRNG
jgi:tetratricopeptide (TPR) repeat protein